MTPDVPRRGWTAVPHRGCQRGGLSARALAWEARGGRDGPRPHPGCVHDRDAGLPEGIRGTEAAQPSFARERPLDVTAVHDARRSIAIARQVDVIDGVRVVRISIPNQRQIPSARPEPSCPPCSVSNTNVSHRARPEWQRRPHSVRFPMPAQSRLPRGSRLRRPHDTSRSRTGVETICRSLTRADP